MYINCKVVVVGMLLICRPFLDYLVDILTWIAYFISLKCSPVPDPPPLEFYRVYRPRKFILVFSEGPHYHYYYYYYVIWYQNLTSNNRNPSEVLLKDNYTTVVKVFIISIRRIVDNPWPQCQMPQILKKIQLCTLRWADFHKPFEFKQYSKLNFHPAL